MALCKVCGIDKCASDDFYSSSAVTCKECVKIRVRSNKAKYDFTEKGVIRVIYKTQKRHNRLRGHGDMPYTKIELKTWLYDNGFRSLYANWVNCNYKKDIKPSVDRVNDLEGYSFSNIKLGTWFDNRKHQYDDIVNGAGTGGKRCKPVKKIGKNGFVIAVYVSYWSAVRDIGYSIEYQLKKGVTCRNGFYWEYSDT